MDYFTWLCSFIDETRGGQDIKRYSQLLTDLFSINYYWLLAQDDNRASYAFELRDIFEKMGGTHHPGIVRKPISVLEVFISMAIKAEEGLMTNTELGDRTGQWFWMMMSNLDFETFDDNIYDVDVSIAVRSKISMVLDRRFAPNGDGGLFPMRHPRSDMRNTDLWTSFMLYLAENYEE